MIDTLNEESFNLMLKNLGRKAWSDILVDIHVDTLTESDPIRFLMRTHDISEQTARRTYEAGLRLMGFSAKEARQKSRPVRQISSHSRQGDALSYVRKGHPSNVVPLDSK